MGELSPWHWIVVLLIFALLFGSKRLPDAARGLGRSLRIFKAEMRSAEAETPVGGPSQPFAPPVPTDAVPTDAMPADAVPTPQSAIPPVTPAPAVPSMAVAEQARPVVDH